LKAYVAGITKNVNQILNSTLSSIILPGSVDELAVKVLTAKKSQLAALTATLYAADWV
jgi:hypothetical protein